MREWRETIEYGLSIALAFLTGNILVTFVLFVLPSTIASSGKPSAGAYRIARMLGQHVGKETMRRRARRIQDLMQTLGPLAGVLATAGGLDLYRAQGHAGKLSHQIIERAAGEIEPEADHRRSGTSGGTLPAASASVPPGR